jgi:hypothetical protein
VAAQVDRDDTVAVVGEYGRSAAPRVPRLSAAVGEDDGRTIGCRAGPLVGGDPYT